MTPDFALRRAAPPLAFGFLLTFGSSVGQTYFIGLFAGAVRADLGLGHAGFGGLYTVATTASAAVLIWLGKAADRFDPAPLAAATLALLAASALALAGADSTWLLVLALFGLRLGGQGMLSHIALTATARWFVRGRGRALGIAMLGYPTGEALLPPLAAVLLAAFAWRSIWFAMAGLLLLAIPIVLRLGRSLPSATLAHARSGAGAAGATAGRGWTRAQMLRDGRFYALLPGITATPYIVTGVLFHQVHLAAVKGWTLPEFAVFYPLYAFAATGAGLGCGWLVDRYGAARLLPYFLLPLALGLAVLGSSDARAVAGLFMTLTGATAGSATVLLGALWPEVYGTAHLGSIRALATALLVFATALAPATIGWLIDRGVELEALLHGLALYASACALGLLIVSPRLGTARV